MAKQSKLYDSYILITQYHYHYHHNPHPLTRQGLSISKQRCAHCAEVQMQAAPLMSAPTTTTTALGHHHTISLRHRIHYIIYYIQGAFFNCSAQISVLKRKMLFNQRGSFVHQEFHGTESLIGYPSFFILILKIGRNSKKSTLYLC